MGLKARLSRITEANYHVSLWKTTEGSEAGWIKSSQGVGITAYMSVCQSVVSNMFALYDF